MVSTARWFGLDAKTRLGVKSLIGVSEPRVVTDAAYTLEAMDATRVVEVNSTNQVTLVVPAGVFEAGQCVNVLQVGSGPVEIAAGDDFTLTWPALYVAGLNAQWAAVTIRFRSPAAAVLSGQLVID